VEGKDVERAHNDGSTAPIAMPAATAGVGAPESAVLDCRNVTKKKGKTMTKSKRVSYKKVTGGRRASKKKTAKKPTAKTRGGSSSRKTIGAAGQALTRPTRKNSQRETAAFAEDAVGSRSGAQSGDLQGLRDIERADSESVDELLEEGNPLEADVVAGVEDAEDDQDREVHTHEVPEDDVPEEYQDKD